MIVVTYATNDQGYFRALEASCRRHGIPFVVLGWGAQWTNFLQKPWAVLEYAQGLDANEFIVMVDAFDVLVLQGADEIMRRYNHLTRKCVDAQIVIGVDNTNGSSVINFVQKLLYPSTCANRSLNTGVQMGPAGVFVTILTKLKRLNNSNDDQILFNKNCSKFREHITVDYTGYIIYTSCTCISPPFPFPNVTPCVLHSPGYGNLDRHCQQLGLPIGKKRRWDGEMYKYVAHFKNQNTLIILVVIIILGILSVFWYLIKQTKNNRVSA